LPSYMLIIWVVVFIAIFYFMAIRPQQRQRKAHTELLNSLKRGDMIVTAAGMYGKVVKVDDGNNTVEVEVSRGVVIKIHRRAVSEIIRDKDQVRALAPGKATRTKSAPAEEAADEGYDESADAAVDETAGDAENIGESEESSQS
jgi:preprotein translocase subunit YajC